VYQDTVGVEQAGEVRRGWGRPGGWAQRNSPSRNATATAPLRSETPNLR
jgi:hypothetical protein